MLFLFYFEQAVCSCCTPNSYDVVMKMINNLDIRSKSKLSEVCGDRMICRWEHLITDVEERGLITQAGETCP